MIQSLTKNQLRIAATIYSGSVLASTESESFHDSMDETSRDRMVEAVHLKAFRILKDLPIFGDVDKIVDYVKANFK